jgi:hypothetical protein
MSIDGQAEAGGLRARCAHPLIDADGYWAADASLMGEAVRRRGGRL